MTLTMDNIERKPSAWGAVLSMTLCVFVLIASEFMTEEQLWNVAHYVRSLAPESPPRVSEVVRAGRVDGGLPASVDDEAWNAADRFYVPLVGQIVVEPRWFLPSVEGVWIQALHDGRELVLRIVWHDPSRSPALIGHCLVESRVILMNAATKGQVVRFMPPLVVTADEVDRCLSAVAEAWKATA